MVNLEYPGHWERWEENLSDDNLIIIEEFSSDVFLLEHSMGALLAWLLADRLNEDNIVKGIIVAAIVPPSRVKKLIFNNLNNDEEIIQYIKRIRQVPEKTLDSSLFKDNIFPTIKNDFKMFNNMASSLRIFKKLSIPCLILYSDENPVIDVEDIFAWNDYDENVVFTKLIGNHFFHIVRTRFLRYVRKYQSLLMAIFVKYKNFKCLRSSEIELEVFFR